MTRYQFKGNIPLTYPEHLHPEQDGVLVADPDEIIEFRDQLPPGDGNWYDEGTGRAHTPPRHHVEEEGVPGTGDGPDQED